MIPTRVPFLERGKEEKALPFQADEQPGVHWRRGNAGELPARPVVSPSWGPAPRTWEFS